MQGCHGVAVSMGAKDNERLFGLPVGAELVDGIQDLN